MKGIENIVLSVFTQNVFIRAEETNSIPLSNSIKYDRSHSFLFDFEPNGIPSSEKWKGKLSPKSYSIQFENINQSIYLA